ncbi:MAG: biotin/lipoyl-containing protein [bacterium]
MNKAGGNRSNGANGDAYRVEINGDVFEIEFLGHEGRIRVDGEEMVLDVQPKAVPDHYSLLLGGRSVVLAVEPTDIANQYRIHTGGYDFSADVISKREAYLREFLRAAGVGTRHGRVTAPMPGLIVKVEASENDLVEEHQGILVMEAMKMENEIKAPVAGRLKSLSVSLGQAVEKGQLLFEIE